MGSGVLFQFSLGTVAESGNLCFEKQMQQRETSGAAARMMWPAVVSFWRPGQETRQRICGGRVLVRIRLAPDEAVSEYSRGYEILEAKQMRRGGPRYCTAWL